MPPTLLWDFDGTLAFREGRWWGCLMEVLDEHDPGHGVDTDAMRASLKDGFPWHTPDRPHPELDTADAWWAPVEALLARAYGRAGYDETRASELAGHARRAYGDPTRTWRLYDDTLPALAELSAEGWQHVILSNHVPELPAIVGHLGLGTEVTAIVNSATTGYEKPHPEAFTIALRTAGNPEVVCMVGDNPTADIAGAEAVGIPAVLVRTEDDPGLDALAERISRATGRAR